MDDLNEPSIAEVRGRWWFVTEIPYWTRLRAAQSVCLLIGHKENLKNIGFGFGNLDRFCWRCGAFLRSVPVDQLTLEEQQAISEIGGWRVDMAAPDPEAVDQALVKGGQ